MTEQLRARHSSGEWSISGLGWFRSVGDRTEVGKPSFASSRLGRINTYKYVASPYFRLGKDLPPMRIEPLGHLDLLLHHTISDAWMFSTKAIICWRFFFHWLRWGKGPDHGSCESKVRVTQRFRRSKGLGYWSWVKWIIFRFQQPGWSKVGWRIFVGSIWA